jgi:GNAT superfamily N-acetyltransferase
MAESPTQQQEIDIIHVDGSNIEQYIDDIIPLFKAYQTFYKWPNHEVSAIRNFLIKRAINGAHVFIVYYTPETTAIPVAFTQLYPIFSSVCLEENWNLNDLFVDEQYRSLKIGQKLIQHAMDWADTQGAFSIKIETTVINIRAQYLYPKMGFKEFSRYDDTILYSHSFERAKEQPYQTYFE